MSHSADADKLLEVPGDELRAVVRDDAGPLAGILLARPLEDRLHLGFGHRLANLPVDEEPAVAVQDAAQEEEVHTRPKYDLTPPGLKYDLTPPGFRHRRGSRDRNMI